MSEGRRAQSPTGGLKGGAVEWRQHHVTKKPLRISCELSPNLVSKLRDRLDPGLGSEPEKGEYRAYERRARA